jgi:ABC-type lipoprotein release transport system permease subunit
LDDYGRSSGRDFDQELESGVQPHDPMVFMMVAIVLSGIAFFAVWFPANRASRIDPAETLRYE